MRPAFWHLAARSASTPEPHEPELADYFDSTDAQPLTGGFTRHNSFARLKFTTSGASLRLGYVADFASNAWLTILVNGTYDQTVTLTADGAEHTADVTLSAGAKTIEIWEGPEYDLEPNVLSGGLVTSIEMLDATLRMIRPTAPARRVVIYGDSISQGYPAEPKDSYFGMMRLDSSFGFTSYGSGGRSLKADANSPGISTTATRIAAMLADNGGAEDLVVVIGTNDWGNAPENPVATFESDLADLVDAVHAARPLAIVRLVSPLDRSGEGTPNGEGDILQDFRDAMDTVAGSRGPWCVYYDASAVIDSGVDTTDGTHLDASGNSKMSDYLLGTVLA